MVYGVLTIGVLITQAHNVEIKKKTCWYGILGLIVKLQEMSELRSIVKGDYKTEKAIQL